MSEKHLKLTPHNVTNDFWWYEENYGITICLEVGGPRHGIQHKYIEQRRIPWRSIRAALARKDK